MTDMSLAKPLTFTRLAVALRLTYVLKPNKSSQYSNNDVKLTENPTLPGLPTSPKLK